LFRVTKPQRGSILFGCGLNPKMNPQMGPARSLKFVAEPWKRWMCCGIGAYGLSTS